MATTAIAISDVAAAPARKPSAQCSMSCSMLGQLIISPLQTDSLPFVSKIYWPENADDAIMDAP